MNRPSIYKSISERTGGDIYIGVVGPVRSGKSTFIRRFMEELVIPNIAQSYMRERTVDELPQACAGRTIMTTEPKFIPEEAVTVTLDDTAAVNIRMIDCVGYIIPSAVGYIENSEPRMVRTPWFDSEIPFNMAAEIGTQKVITEHSTVGVVVTTDGTVTGIDREEYAECEERVISELLGLNKPFVILMNSLHHDSEETKKLCKELEEKYSVPCIAINCLDMTRDDIQKILANLLFAFPVKEINIAMPKWLNSLEKGHKLKTEIFDYIKSSCENVKLLRDVGDFCEALSECDKVKATELSSIDPGSGVCKITLTLDPTLFYKVLSEESGIVIDGENELMPTILELVKFKKQFEKFSKALEEVEETGYGIVMPEQEELTLDEPEIIRQGGKYGVRLKANAPSIHLIRADIGAEVAPIVGSEKQSEELITYLLNDFEDDPGRIWDTNIFGKSLSELVSEGLHQKLNRLPDDAREKLREAVERIINEGCSGLICLIV